MNLKFPLLLFIFLFYNYSIAQTKSDLNKIWSVNNLIKSKEAKTSKFPDPFIYNFCDDDNDGFLQIDIKPILETVKLEVTKDLIGNTKETLIIGTSTGNVIKIEDILGAPNNTLICSVGEPLYDVAVDSNLDIYQITPSSISKLDKVTCSENKVIDKSGNALSFDTKDNLYFSSLDIPRDISSAVYRMDAGLNTVPYIWHDFLNGSPSGDFVMLGGSMYIAWNLLGIDKLYKVEVDADIKYISHVDLGELKSSTFGLASELGVLYGVTPGEVYKIDAETKPLTNTTVINNDFANGSWWGAAGLHEAVDLVSSAHLSFADATNGIDPLAEQWVNVIKNQQTLFIRTENILTGKFVISSVVINIHSTPVLANTPVELTVCDVDNDGIELFNLRLQEPTILGIQNANTYKIDYFTDNTYNNLITNPNEYTNRNQIETVYFKMINKKSATCSLSSSFTIRLVKTIKANQPINYELCDNMVDGDDSNGFVDFLLSTKDVEILGTLSLTDYKVSYHTSLRGAETNTTTNVIDKNIAYTNIVRNMQRVYVRVERLDNTECADTSISFDLIVNKLPRNITERDIIVLDDFTSNSAISSIRVNLPNTEIDYYEYALRNENGIVVAYQDSPLFSNVLGGFYTVLIQDKKGCGKIEVDVSVIKISKFFTPNNDGINDYWNVRGVTTVSHPISEIFIFDRFGKKIGETNLGSIGWNGIYKGKTLPSNDYWFFIKLVDRNGKAMERRGNFSLLR